jgi:3-oxoacyl-[acyl-carrier-protein] synthase-3
LTAAGIRGVALSLPAEERTNEAWPSSFVERFRASREDADFTTVEAKRSRPYAELYVRHALPHADDPFKGSIARRVSPPDEPTVSFDARAASRALEDAAVDPRDVDLVLSSALVPDRLCPGNGPGVQHLTGCVNAAAISVESYCSAALAQMELAAGLIEAGRARHVLCVQSHHLARANDLASPLSPLFGDGSSAFVMGEVPDGYGLVRMIRRGDGALADAVTWVYPETPTERWYGDVRGPVRPGTDDLEAARYFTDHLLAYPIESVRELCEACNFDPAEAGALITMQPIAWFQPAVADGLGLPLERVPSTHDRYAHMGAVGFVANLARAREVGLLQRGTTALLYSHGAGMTRYAGLYRWWQPT